MTFDEARLKLKEISGGMHRSMTFSISDYEDGTTESSLTIIVIPGHPKKPIAAHNCKSWSDALDLVSAEIKSRLTPENVDSTGPDQ